MKKDYMNRETTELDGKIKIQKDRRDSRLQKR